MKAANRRKLPKSSVALTALGLGCAQMGNLYKVTSLQDATGAFDGAWQAGVRYFDTAPLYGYTRSERRLGTLLTDRKRDDYVVSTKAGRVMKPDMSVGTEEEGFMEPLPFRPVFDYSYDGIMKSFEASQQRLGVPEPDILYVHDIGTQQHGDMNAYYWSQLTDGGFKALLELRQQGLVKAIGLGVNEFEIIRQAMQFCDIDVAMLAGRYTLLEQQSLGFMDECEAAGVGIVAAGVFNSGVLAGNRRFNYNEAPPKVMAHVDALASACDELGVCLQAAALQFPMAHGAVVSVVSGARNAQQVDCNIAWFEEFIPPEFWIELKARGLIDQNAPVPTGKA